MASISRRKFFGPWVCVALLAVASANPGYIPVVEPEPEAIKAEESYPVGYGLGLGGVGAGGIGAGGIGGAGLGAGALGVGGVGGVGGGVGLGGVGLGGHGLGGLGGGFGGYQGGLFNGGGGYASGNTLNSFGGSNFGSGLAGGGGASQNGGYLSGGGQSGQTGGLSNVGYTGQQGAKNVGQQDSGYYGDLAGGRNNYNQGGGYEYGNNKAVQGLSSGGLKNAGGHKKGYSTKGFQNFHHKDETGKSSTFFDESNDEGGHYNLQNQEGLFGNHGGSAFKGAVDEGRFLADSKGRQGKYNSGYELGGAQGVKGQQGQQAYFGNQEGYGQNKAYNDYGKKSNLQEQQFGGQQGQHFGSGFQKGGKFGGTQGFGGYGGYGGGYGGF